MVFAGGSKRSPRICNYLRYHGKMSLLERRKSHTAFLRDDCAIMVATVAYGEIYVGDT